LALDQGDPVSPSIRPAPNGWFGFIVPIVTAVVLSIGSSFVSVAVMGNEVGRLQEDARQTQVQTQSLDRQLTALTAAKAVEDRTSEGRWERVEKRLTGIETINAKILQRLPVRGNRR
jgi:hypothetical protein